MANTLYLFIGSTFLECDEQLLANKYFKSKNSVSNALYERKLLNGFLKDIQPSDDCMFISAPSVGWWPSRSKKILVEGFKSNENLITIKYFALWRLTNFFKSISLKRNLNKILKSSSKYQTIRLIACEAYKPYLDCVRYAKRKSSTNIFSTLIVPDLPDNIISSQNFIYKFFKRINVGSIYSIASKYIDSFLCFTSSVNKKINKEKKPYLIREGIIDLSQINLSLKNDIKDEKIHCVFIGKVDKRNGLEIIVETAKIAPSNIVFDVYGSFHDGDISIDLPNLNFYGFISPSEVSAVLSGADVLLSPRIPEGEAISCSFPSKIFDYISYRKPIVTYKLPCYFEDVDKIFTYPKDFSANSFLEAIKSAIVSYSSKEAFYDMLIERYSNAHIAKDIIELSEFKVE